MPGARSRPLPGRLLVVSVGEDTDGSPLMEPSVVGRVFQDGAEMFEFSRGGASLITYELTAVPERAWSPACTIRQRVEALGISAAPTWLCQLAWSASGENIRVAFSAFEPRVLIEQGSTQGAPAAGAGLHCQEAGEGGDSTVWALVEGSGPTSSVLLSAPASMVQPARDGLRSTLKPPQESAHTPPPPAGSVEEDYICDRIPSLLPSPSYRHAHLRARGPACSPCIRAGRVVHACQVGPACV